MTTTITRNLITGREYEGTDPKGNKFVFTHLSDFCKQYDLELSAVSRVVNGKRRSHKGWGFQELNVPEEIAATQVFVPSTARFVPISATTPEGETHQFESTQKCAESSLIKGTGISREMMTNNCRGLIGEVKGWTFRFTRVTEEEAKKFEALREEKNKIKRYKIISPDGIVMHSNNLASFCREKGILRGEMSKIMKDPSYYYKGWFIERLVPKRTGRWGE